MIDENIVFSKTNMRLISRSNISKKEIEILAYALLIYKSDKNEDNEFIVRCLINGWINREEYQILSKKYPRLFSKSIEEAFGPSNQISNGTLLADILDLREAKNCLRRLREGQTHDYWDELSKIKKKGGKWFHCSH